MKRKYIQNEVIDNKISNNTLKEKLNDSGFIVIRQFYVINDNECVVFKKKHKKKYE
jgi:hypothetical protein